MGLQTTAVGALFFATMKVFATAHAAGKHHAHLHANAPEVLSLLRKHGELVSPEAFTEATAAEDARHLAVTSNGHFQMERHPIMRRDDEVIGAAAALVAVEDVGDTTAAPTAVATLPLATARSAVNASQANLAVQITPFEWAFKTHLDSPIRMGLAVGMILLAVVSLAGAVLVCSRKPLSREALQKREQAALNIQRRVRGHQIRMVLKKEERPSSSDQDSQERKSKGRRGSVLLLGDDIQERYRGLRPGADGQGDRDYSSIVHTLSYDELSQVLNSKLSSDDSYRCATEAAGLREQQAEAYLTHHGLNKITPPVREDIWVKLLKLVFGGLFNILLWFCVVAQVLLIRIKIVNDPKRITTVDEFVTPAILTFVIVGAGVLQWYTEMQAENMMESVQQMQSTQEVRVVRRDAAGNRVDLELEPERLVPGDICFLEGGMRIPADVRVLHCTEGMEVDNSALTGESMPEARVACVESDVPIMEARNVAFCGTTVLVGKATCMVHCTGDNTFLGKIAYGLKGQRTLSTLEIQIEHFVHIVALVAIAVGLLSIGANLMSPVHRSLAKILENSATALFAQVPEGLLPTVTISLMIASRQLSQRNVLVRKLDAVETLGCVSVICSDKTGTLTTGEMSAVTMLVPEVLQDGLSTRRPSIALSWSDATDPLERLQPRVGTSSKMTSISRQGGVFDAAITTAWNFQSLCVCALLNNGATVSGVSDEQGEAVILPGTDRDRAERWKATGSPTEVAIFRAAVDSLGGLADAMQCRGEFGLVHEVPFNSETKWMLTIHTHAKAASTNQRYQMILKGAPERVLNKCVLSDAERKEIDSQLYELMRKGLRVLCFASRSLDGSGGLPNFKDADPGGTGGDSSLPLDGFHFVGLMGIEDPPRHGVADAVAASQAAGVKVIMVTGDHPETAKAIAGRINIVPASGLVGDAADFCAVSGAEMEGKLPLGDDFSEEDSLDVRNFWIKAVAHTRVFARVSPIHKQVIVQAYQRFGNNGIGDIVAMTGDGVNDAPALKQANVGVAMGIRGTEVAKDAADIVLMDDNFASIVAGMEQGRLASDNLQKSIMYTLCSKVPQVAPTFAEILGVPMALDAVQVLLIDIGTDIWTAIAYALQPAEDALMRLPPRHPHFEKLVNWKVLVYSYCYIGQLQMVLCWAFYMMVPGILELFRKENYSSADQSIHVQGMTVYYWTLMLGQIAAAISTTTKTQRVFGPGGYGFPNVALTILIVVEIALGLSVIYIPAFNRVFSTSALPAKELLLPIVTIPIICAAEEIRKWFVRSSIPLAPSFGPVV